MSMTSNAQPARSIDGDLLCVFYQYLVKEAQFKAQSIMPLRWNSLRLSSRPQAINLESTL